MLAVSALLYISPAVADIYKQIDEFGNIVFTDTPGTNAERVALEEPNSLPPPDSASGKNRAGVDKKPKTKLPRYDILIKQPINDAVIPPGPGNFSVHLEVSPPLIEGHRIQLLMDSTAYGKARADTHFALTNVFRGSHRIAATIIDTKGKVLAKSAPVLVHVFRPRKKR